MTSAPNLPQVLEPRRSDTEVSRLLEKFPIPDGVTYSYGTAGFRIQHEFLESIMVKVGLLACLQSLECQQAVGVMVTASHNDESYNGVKIAGPDGGMMPAAGEERAVFMANHPNIPELTQWFFAERAATKEKSNASSSSFFFPTLHLGRDTRQHSPALACLVSKAARAAGCYVMDHGIVSTPMLHHCVLHANACHVPSLIPVRPNAAGYYDLLAHSYVALLISTTGESSLEAATRVLLPPLVVDCACGVGFPALTYLVTKLHELGVRRPIVATNGPTAGPLNAGCGSEHVQKSIAPPIWYASDDNCPNIQELNKSYCASLDGDADRIVFFSQQQQQQQDQGDAFCLLDGDKIAALLCDFVQTELNQLDLLPLPSVGVVQTAYANGASTKYLRQILGDANVRVAKTGVKHVHVAAHEHFDVGIYFEANGHGTILFGNMFYECMSRADTRLRGTHTSRATVAWQRLSVLPSLVNQAVGDALSDLLLVDAILQIKGWSISDWNNIYTDLPSRQGKVSVKDRSVIRTNDNETQCVAPSGVQSALVDAMKKYCGRAFVRPSGTEDVVRVYAEAPTRAQANALAQRACEIVYQYCEGVGDQPTLPASRI